VRSIGLHFHRVRLYADGRLIWVRDQRLPSSAGEPRLTIEQVRKTGVPLGVVEQRLTPAGVELMRQATIGDGLGELGIHDTGDDETRWNLPGVLWGGLELAEGDLVHDKVWADYEWPGRLADPAAWLPASAWEDQRIGAYVPTTYGVCANAPDDRPSRALDLLPERARKLLDRTTDALDLPAGDALAGRCLQAATDDARAIAAALEEAGLPLELGEHALGYRLDADEELWFLPVLPDGQVVCECG
jgi:hypothetical protein